MGDYRSLLLIVVLLSVITMFVTFFITPFLSEPSSSSSLTSVVGVIQNGSTINWTVPIFGDISATFYPSVFWFGIDFVTDGVVADLTALSYLDDIIAIPVLILTVVLLAYVIISTVRGN